MKYTLGSSFTIRITHMEKEEILGSHKQKLNLCLGSKQDSHKHDLVNFSRQWVDIETRKISHVQIKQPSSSVNQNEVVDITNGCVEVLDASYGDGIWHTKWCPKFHVSIIQHHKKPPTIFILQGLSSSQLPLVFMPLLTLVCPFSS